MGQVRACDQVREGEELLENGLKHPLYKYHNPHRRFIIGKYFLATDILPKEYHELYTGWTLDGAYDHRERPESPWELIEHLGLVDKLYIERLEHEMKEKDQIISGFFSAEKHLIEELVYSRTQLKEKKNYEGADAIRNVLKHAGVEIKDTKEGPIWTGSLFWSRKH